MKRFLLFVVLAAALLAGYLIHLGPGSEDLLYRPLTIFNDLILKIKGAAHPAEPQQTPESPPVLRQATPAPAPKSAQPAQPSVSPPQSAAAIPDTNVDLAQLSQSRGEWPKTVVLKEMVEFPAVLDGKVVGSVKAPPDTRVQLVMVMVGKIGVEYQGGGAMVDARETDLIEQVIAARHVAALGNSPAASSPPAVQQARVQNADQSPTPGQSVSPRSVRASLREFVTTVQETVTTSAPSLDLFLNMKSQQKAAEFPLYESAAWNRLLADRKLGIDRYNAFVSREFPDKPDLKLNFDGTLNVVPTGQIEVSPARILCLAVDMSSADSKIILKWVKSEPSPINTVQSAMETLDKELSARDQDTNTVRILNYLHEARAALQNLMNNKEASVDDQRKVVFFLTEAGIAK